MADHRFEVFAPAAGDARTQAAASLIARSFGLPEERVRSRLLDLQGPSGVLRLLHSGSQVGCMVGVMDRLRSSSLDEPVVFLNGAALEPEHRSGSLALSFFTGAVRHGVESGASAAVLFPSSWSLYGSLGFGIMAARCTMRAQLHKVRSRSIKRICVRVEIHETLADDALGRALERVRDEFLVDCTALARVTDLFWSAVLDRPDQRNQLYLFREGEDVVGFVAFAVVGRTLKVADFAAIDEVGISDILALIASFETVCVEVEWIGAVGDVLHLAIRDAETRVAECHYSMARVLDLTGLLERRRYEPAHTGEYAFTVRDGLLARNNGMFELSVRDGRGSVRRSTGAPHSTVIGIADLSSALLGGVPLRRTMRFAVTGRDREELRALDTVLCGAPASLPERDLF